MSNSIQYIVPSSPQILMPSFTEFLYNWKLEQFFFLTPKKWLTFTLKTVQWRNVKLKIIKTSLPTSVCPLVHQAVVSSSISKVYIPKDLWDSVSVFLNIVEFIFKILYSVDEQQNNNNNKNH